MHACVRALYCGALASAKLTQHACCAHVPTLRQAILVRKLSYPSHLSPLAVSFLSAALTRNPKARPTARQLLHHPFIAAHQPRGPAA